MKKVYIPTKEELYKLQSIGANIYKYMLIRTMEAIIIEDIVCDEHDMLEFTYDHLSEFPEIIQAIGRLYPERIQNCERAIKDVQLCRSIVEILPERNRTIYGLDNLVYFSENSNILFDKEVVLNTARELSDKLPYSPKYRFDYKEPNILLDDIFACELSNLYISKTSINDFSTIDPIYTIKLTNSEDIKNTKIRESMVFNAKRNMIKYVNRYGIQHSIGSEYEGKDILSNPDERVKKLIRTLEYHKKNYQQ